MRIVSLEGAPDGFAVSITRNNNTQNRIDTRNFVALDPEQERLKAEFLIDAIDYEYRQGEIEHSTGNRLGLVETTVALACTDTDVSLSTQAKREIGRLWEDIERPPYKRLFNASTSSDNIWQRVKAFRRIDNAINAIALKSSGKMGNIAVHGNRFLAHCAYHKVAEASSHSDLSDKTDAEISKVVNGIFEDLVKEIEKNYGDNYVASLFKNQSKCKDLKDKLL
jgi:hypothetical protein